MKFHHIEYFDTPVVREELLLFSISEFLITDQYLSNPAFNLVVVLNQKPVDTDAVGDQPSSPLCS